MLAALCELTVAVIGLSAPAAWGGAIVAATFVGLAIVAELGLRRAPDSSCGCFGDEHDAPFSRRHVIINLLCGLIAAVAVVIEPASLAAVASRSPAGAAGC